MANLRGWQLVVLVLLVVLLFGSKKLPDAARSLGRSLRIFKAETKALVDEDDDAAVASGELTQGTTNPTEVSVSRADTAEDAKGQQAGPASS